MRRTIATVSLSGSLSQKLAAAAAAGFDGVEVFETDLLASRLSPHEVRQRAADLGLSIDLYQPFRDFEGEEDEQLARNLRRAEAKFEVMERLGADLLLVCSSVSALSRDDDALAAEQLRLLAERGAEHGIRIAYEALAWGRNVSTFEHAWRIVELADHQGLGTCLDSFHILARGGDPKGIAAIPGEKIFFLQLADAPLTAMDVLQWSRHYRCFPGQGGLDVAGVARAAVEAGYAGPLSLEVFNDVFRQADAGPTAVDALRSLLMVEEAIGRAELPTTVVPTGFAFAELAATDPEPLRSLLVGLGFERSGRHRGGKPVDLWERAGARVLLNSAAGPAAAAAGGTAQVAALGLESPDPDAAVRRAQAVLAPELPRLRAPDDVALNAVAAPDGTELFFCATGRPGRANWRLDFPPPREQPEAGAAAAALVTGVDHVALTQPWHRFDEAALFYPAVLGLQLQESLDLADPYGLYRSRAASGPGSSLLRIALNAAPGPDHEDGRPQHIALAVSDVAAVVARLHEQGLATLAVPDNYYEDLRARLEFPAGELERLRRFDLLYDRDQYGEFRHCYTPAVGRISFELVERSGGYRGYGAVNAPVRLAAQRAQAHTMGRPGGE
ncbi:sugar phosphate isomerase/epimerase and 4-hydroxyphenylpyruvate domain-containing protein [Streptacidiphilus carbonis]|uniref:sugar phosphate isomerase/epimerase and 4-hydroxyphenylpyruvate domain-containing protein n=1 Tax=Streptacidiphilus carbonis TaxID=105422 RepID=UPI0005A70254|nr:sugar phosphate isomerase/epimerase and 4-hydroxyphenylpyruvate domain-containing protein [Streptacidiphilus carbonis]